MPPPSPSTARIKNPSKVGGLFHFCSLCPSLPDRRQLSRVSDVHFLMRFEAERYQVPFAIGVLWVLFCRQAMMHHFSRNAFSKPQRFLAQILIALQYAQPKQLPMSCLIVHLDSHSTDKKRTKRTNFHFLKNRWWILRSASGDRCGFMRALICAQL